MAAKKALADPRIRCTFTRLADPDELIANPKNPNRHSEKQLTLLAKILDRQGFRRPIVVSKRSGFVISGHGRLEAAKKAGFTLVPVDEQDYANEAAEWADMVADNKIAELAETDKEAIDAIVAELEANDADFDFDLLGMEGLDGEPPDIEDGFDDDGEGDPARSSDTVLLIGPYRTEIDRERFLKWEAGIHREVGVTQDAIIAEMIKRMGV